MAAEVTSTAGRLISRTRGTISTQASTAAMITTMEMLAECSLNARSMARYGEVWRAPDVPARHDDPSHR